MKQLDLFDKSFNGINKSDFSKIYESPDKGKTVYEREFGADPSTRKIVKTAVQQQWNITYKTEV
jgi:hypothetical protein